MQVGNTRWPALLAALVISLIGSTGPALPWARTIEDVVYFEVEGATAQEIRASIERNTPRKGYEGWTESRINWSFRTRPSDGKCRVVNVDVEQIIKIDMPRLKAGTALRADTRKKWNDFLETLWRHEQQHAQFARDAAAEIEGILGGFWTEGKCGAESNKKINAAAHAIMEKMKRLNRQFDKDVEEGRREEPKFP